jgi:hypothetical protein
VKQFAKWILDDRGKRLSLAVAIIYFAVAIIGRYEAVVFFQLFGFLLLPLACIWFGDQMGKYTGFSSIGQPYINKESPGCLVTLVGWILLLLPVLAGIISALVNKEH